MLIDPGDVKRGSVDDGTTVAGVGVDGIPVPLDVMTSADTDGPSSDSGPQLRLLETLTEVFHSGICNVLLNATTLSFVDRDCEGLLTEIGELIGEGGRRTGSWIEGAGEGGRVLDTANGVCWGVLDSSIGIVSLIIGSVVPVEARAVMEASSFPSASAGDDAAVDRSFFLLPNVENLLRGSKRRRRPIRGTGGACEVEGRD